MSASIDSAADLDPPETVRVLDQSREDVVDRVRVLSVDEKDEVAYGVTYETGRQITIESLGRLIEQNRLVP